LPTIPEELHINTFQKAFFALQQEVGVDIF